MTPTDQVRKGVDAPAGLDADGACSTPPEPDHRLMGEQEFRAILSRLLSGPARIEFTCNRSTLISVQTARDGLKIIRLQHAFRAADPETLYAIAAMANGSTDYNPDPIREFLSIKQDIVKFFSRPRQKLQSFDHKGAHRDLSLILKKIANLHGISYNGIRIAWSRLGKIKGRRISIRFGSYCAAKQLIRIHPVLDSPEIPDYFVEYVVYHELLHALHPPESSGKGERRVVHTPQFKRREKVFYRLQEARAFEMEFIKARLGGKS